MIHLISDSISEILESSLLIRRRVYFDSSGFVSILEPMEMETRQYPTVTAFGGGFQQLRQVRKMLGSNLSDRSEFGK